jgi:hypothetical protein
MIIIYLCPQQHTFFTVYNTEIFHGLTWTLGVISAAMYPESDCLSVISYQVSVLFVIVFMHVFTTMMFLFQVLISNRK